MDVTRYHCFPPHAGYFLHSPVTQEADSGPPVPPPQVVTPSMLPQGLLSASPGASQTVTGFLVSVSLVFKKTGGVIGSQACRNFWLILTREC